MNGDNAIILLHRKKTNEYLDIEIPLRITANELIIALNTVYQLGLDTETLSRCSLCAENPIVLLRGEVALKEFGVRNGTILHVE